LDENKFYINIVDSSQSDVQLCWSIPVSWWT